jgi:hypothetical protein
MHALVSSFFGAVTALYIESHSAKCIKLAGIVLCFQRDSFGSINQPTWLLCNLSLSLLKMWRYFPKAL